MRLSVRGVVLILMFLSILAHPSGLLADGTGIETQANDQVKTDFNFEISIFALLFSLGSLVVSIWAVKSGWRRLYLSLSIDLAFKLHDRFESNRFQELRMKAAKYFGGQSQVNTQKAISEKAIGEILTFYELVGEFTRRRVIEKELVWSLFFDHLNYFYHFSSKIIKATQESHPTAWTSTVSLHEDLAKIAKKKAGTLPPQEYFEEARQTEESLVMSDSR